MPATQKSQISNSKSQIPNSKSQISNSKSQILKPRRLEEIASSKAGLFAIDPTLLSVEHGFNHRIHWGDLEALAADIEANGLDQPLKIRKVKNTETIFIVAGHRRHRAITTILIPQGRWQDPENPKQIRPVHCYAEAQGTSEADRLFSQIAGNTGLPYTLLEKARVYQDILCFDETIKPADLARRSGETKQAVSDALTLVRKGSNHLIERIEKGVLTATTAIQIIKQAGDDNSAQESLLLAALSNALKADRKHITPKDIPAPPTVDPVKGWKFVPIKPKNNVCKIGLTARGTDIFAAEGIKAKGMPPGQSLAIGWSRQKNGHHIALAFQGAEEGKFRGIHMDRSSPLFTDMPETLDCYIRGEITEVWPHLESATLDRLITLIAAAAPIFAKPEKSDSPSDPDSSLESSSLKSCVSPPAFTLYQIQDAPQDPLPDGTYHETNRFVLSPLPEGCQRLHLLSALTEDGTPCYGYRYNDITLLPDPSESSSAGTLPDQGFPAILNRVAAFASIFTADSSLESSSLESCVSTALYDALCRYFPEEGHPEEPDYLSFVAIPDAPTSEPTGYEAIIKAPSTNRDGSGPGSGGSGFVSPEAGMKSVNKVLEELDGKGIPDRVTAVEIAMRICNGESTPATLKNYLLGK